MHVLAQPHREEHQERPQVFEGAKRSIVRPSQTMYLGTVMALLYNMEFDYVTKMSYNKEKELVSK